MWSANNMNIPLPSSSWKWSGKKGRPVLSSLTTAHHKAINIENFTVSCYSSSCFCFYCCRSSNKDGSRNQLFHFDLLDSKRPSSLRFSVRCSLNQGTSPESLPSHQPSQQREGFWKKWKVGTVIPNFHRFFLK
uniref:Uncharacterized protein n=1 Tax=Rhizophora mucronata TaxID=61149 RepID=A0A2P2JTF2_RHIMU